MIARDVFHCSVTEMLARVSARELTEWMAFLRLEAKERAAAEAAAEQSRAN